MDAGSSPIQSSRKQQHLWVVGVSEVNSRWELNIFQVWPAIYTILEGVVHVM